MCKEIPLSQGYVALIDDCDYARVAQYKWSYDKGYAVRALYIRTEDGVRRKKIMMHRFIANTPPGYDTDHRDRTRKLDNRRDNLRTATRSQNNANSAPRTGHYKGIRWRKRDKLWEASITVHRKKRHLCCSKDAEKAARSYDLAALAAWGKYAGLNFEHLRLFYSFSLAISHRPRHPARVAVS